MKAKWMVGTGGLVICGAAAWIAFDAHRSAASASAFLEQRIRERPAFVARLQEADRKMAASEARRVELESKPQATPVRPAPAPTRQSTPGNRSLERAVLLNDPALQALWTKATKARYARTFGPFYAEHGLGSDQVAQFEAALMKREEAKLDLAAAEESQGPESRSAIATLEAKADAEFKSAIAAALGSDGLQQLQEYERSLGPRMVVATIGSWASLEGVPLTDGQAQHLTATIATSTSGRTIDWAAVDAEARRVLSPKQLAVVARVRAEGDLDSAIAKARTADTSAKAGTARRN